MIQAIAIIIVAILLACKALSWYCAYLNHQEQQEARKMHYDTYKKRLRRTR